MNPCFYCTEGLSQVCFPSKRRSQLLKVQHLQKRRMLKGPELNLSVLHISVFQENPDWGGGGRKIYSERFLKYEASSQDQIKMTEFWLLISDCQSLSLLWEVTRR